MTNEELEKLLDSLTRLLDGFEYLRELTSKAEQAQPSIESQQPKGYQEKCYDYLDNGTCRGTGEPCSPATARGCWVL